MEDMLSYITLAFVLSMCSWAVSSFRSGLRGDDISRVAERIGFRYLRSGFGVPLMDSFNQGDDRKFCDLLSGHYSGTETMLFDYEYTPETVDTDVFGFSRKRQTIAAFHPTRALAEFRLDPRGWRHKLDTTGAGRYIVFDDDPIFSQRYVLSGRDEAEIRRSFTPELRASLTRTSSLWIIQSSDGWVIIYIPRWRVKPDGIIGFLDQASSLLNHLTGVSTPARPLTASRTDY